MIETTFWIIVIPVATLLLGSVAGWFIAKSIAKRQDQQLDPEIERLIAAERHANEQLDDSQAMLKLLKEKYTNLQADMQLLEQAINNQPTPDDKDQIIEDLEDEIGMIRRHLRKTRRDYDETCDKYTDLEARSGILQRDLTATRNELDRLCADVNAKDEAIALVNGVLSAPEVADTDILAVDGAVKKIESIIYDQYIPLIDDEQRKWQVRKIMEYWANLQRKSWLKDKKVIAFIGEFSAGKTSIVNRILQQDNPDCPQLPVSVQATTAIATYISHGSDFTSQFVDENGELRQMPAEMFVKIDKELLSKIDVSSIIRYFIVRYNNDNLRGLSILDTPGFSSNDIDDRQRTLEVIKEADALFWVMDANTGDINRTSLEIIAEHRGDLPLYIIINKADTKSPEELYELEANIRQTMDEACIPVSGYLMFSKTADLTPLMDVIHTINGAHYGHNITEIRRSIFDDLENLQHRLNEMRSSLRNQQSWIESNEATIDDDLRQLIDVSARIKSLPQYNKRLFGLRSGYFRMDKNEYFELFDLCNTTINSAKQVQICFNQFKTMQKDYHTTVANVADLKQRLRQTQHVLDQLTVAMTKL